MAKIIKDTIHANGIDIGIYTSDFENEFIIAILKGANSTPLEIRQAQMHSRCHPQNGLIRQVQLVW